jgi:hypothetical protein
MKQRSVVPELLPVGKRTDMMEPAGVFFFALFFWADTPKITQIKYSEV